MVPALPAQGAGRPRRNQAQRTDQGGSREVRVGNPGPGDHAGPPAPVCQCAPYIGTA